MGKYLFMLADSRLTLKYKTYSVTTKEDDLEEWQSNTYIKEFGILEGKKKARRVFLGTIAVPILWGLVNKIFGGRRRKTRIKNRRIGERTLRHCC